ncbi:MAG: hypothetical protein L0I76_35595, partial [Pseudonocardia sp.]|nr:hypothetical protein [Pseudonocardia sp.]
KKAMDAAGTAAEAGGKKISAAVKSSMDTAAAAAQAGATKIQTSISTSLNQAAEQATTAMNRIPVATKAAMTAATAAVTAGMAAIKQALEQTLTDAVKLTEDSWRKIVQTFTEQGRRTVEITQQTARACVAAITAQNGAMYQAGFTLISRLAAGMTAARAQAVESARATAAAIKAQFPASPAKEGPLSGRGDPLRSGGVIVQRLAAGITAQASTVQAALAPILARLSSRITDLGTEPMMHASRDLVRYLDHASRQHHWRHRPRPPSAPRLVGVETGGAGTLRPDAPNAVQGGDVADAVGIAVFQALHKARLEVDGTGLARVVARGNRDLARR